MGEADNEIQRFIVLGCFGICVVAGEVTVAGATLPSSENILWVYATHCSAVPVIRTTQDSRLQFHNDTNSTHLRKLGRLSPLLRRLWNEPAESNHNKKRTFRFVSYREFNKAYIRISDTIHRLELHLMPQRGAPYRSWFHRQIGTSCSPLLRPP